MKSNNIFNLLSKGSRFFCVFIFLSVTTSLKATDYYWIGGSSTSWNDIANWKLNSQTGPTAGNPPTIVDNVFFGTWSNFTVSNKTVQLVAASHCANMSFSNCPVAPILNQLGTQVLNVSGTLFQLQNGMAFSINTLNFTSNSPITVTTASVTIDAMINIAGNGNYTVTDVFKCSQVLTNNGNGNFICSGLFEANGFTKSGAGNVDFMSTAKLNNSSSTLKLSGGGIYNFNGTVTNGQIQFTNGVINTNNYSFNVNAFTDLTSTLSHTLNAGNTQFTIQANGDAWNFTGAGGILNILPASKISIDCYGDFRSKADTYYTVVFPGVCSPIANITNSMDVNGTTFVNDILFTSGGRIVGYNSTFLGNITFMSTGHIGCTKHPILGIIPYNTNNLTFNTNVTINGDGGFGGNNTFNNLVLNAYNYTFVSSSTQSITAAFTATVPPCTGLKEINSNPSAQAYLSISPTASISCNNSKIAGMAIIGNTITAAGSYNAGNNTNITFAAFSPTTLYWVGGSSNGGNWNDANHWSLVNNGIYPPAGGGCVPTLLDNIVFNSNSGAISTITLTGAPAYCHNMSWLGASGSPTLAIPITHTLNIYGSVILQNSLRIRTQNINMMSSGTESITCNGTCFGDITNSNSYIIFQAPGKWYCMDNFYAQRIWLKQGELNSNNQNMDLFGMQSVNGATLTVGTSTLDVRGNGYLTWDFFGAINTLPGNVINFLNLVSANGFYITLPNQIYWDVVFHAGVPLMNIGANNTIFHNVIFKNGGNVTGNNTIFNRLDFGTSSTGANSGITGNNKIGTFNCYGPYTFTFGGNETQTITAALNFSNTPCNGKMTIKSNSSSATNFNVTGATFLNINDAYVSNIKLIGGSIIANNSIDMLGNTNITFATPAPKTLYWIGGSGNWNDPNHWTTNLTYTVYPSGSYGCVPTRFDNVVFLGATTGFTATTNAVALGTGPLAECRNISWLNAIGNPSFDVGQVSIYGSIIGQTTMRWETAVNMITNTGNMATITSNGMSFINSYEAITFSGGGTRTLLDNFMQDPSGIWTANVYLQDGVLNTNNNNFDVCVFSALGNSTLTIGTSAITAYGWSTNASSTPVLALPGSKIRITSSCCVSGGSGMTTKTTDIYQDVIFTTSSSNTGLLSGGAHFSNVTFNPCKGIVSDNNTFKKLSFFGDGTLNNNNITDTLILSAGKTYALQASGTQTITSKLYASGNSCQILYLNSTTAGSQAKLNVQAGSMFFDYDNIKDINASPSYTAINIGGYSFNSGNNTNINFVPTSTTGIGGVASNYAGSVSSLTVCNNQLPVILNTRDFYPNPYTVFNWSNGSHADTLIVNAAGVYSVNVVYGPSCSVPGQITIVVNTTSVTALASPTAVCLGNSSMLTASGANTYNWLPTTALSNSTISNPISTPTSNITYTITGTNTVTGCSNKTVLSIAVNPKPSINSVITNSISCFGGSTGSVSVNAIGGTPAYSYSYSPSVSSITNTANGLVAGNYTATVRDANLCTATQTFNIIQPVNAVSISSTTSSNLACFGVSTGSAAVLAIGGTPAYTYSWTGNSSTTSSATGLAAGNYTVIVKDANLCTKTQTFTITQPASALSVNSVSSSSVGCFGSSTGSASLLAIGGTPAYTYSWMGSSSISNTATGLAAGNYTATIKDANLCTKTQTFTITQPASALSITSASSNSVACFGASTGSASVIATGGTPAYSYSWTGNSSTSNSAGNLAAGNYTTIVTDANNCIATNTIIINQPTLLAVTLTGTTQAGCNLSNGSATVSASGGTPAYNYSWTPPSPAISFTTSVATTPSLAAGVTHLAVKDANGCISPLFINITNPNAPVIAPTQTNVLCYGNATGAASANINGGTAPYSYSWTPAATSTGSLATNLTSGNYIIAITDAANCATGYVFNITEPLAPLTVSSIITSSVVCYGGTGSATVNVTGGTPGYTLNWQNNTSTTNSATGYSAGTYTYQVTDANNCITASNSFVISQPSASLTASTTQSNVLCQGQSNGVATVSVNGGTSGYIYSWLPVTINSFTNTATALPAGSYTAIVIDANGCSNTQTISITEPIALSVSITNTTQASCGLANGSASVVVTGGSPAYSYNWTTPSNSYTISTANTTSLSAGSNAVIVRDANGCNTQTVVTITNPNAPLITIFSTNVNCFGDSTGSAAVSISGGTPVYSYAWSTGSINQNLANLSAGSYTLNVVDANNCRATQVATINQPSTAISILVNTNNVNCFGDNNGSATAIASGGTPNYIYNWMPGNIITASLTNASAGVYSVVATDINGCATQRVITINGPTKALTITSVNTQNPICEQSNGVINVVVNGGTAFYTYNWSNGNQNQNLANVPEGTYTLTVSDANNCKDTLIQTLSCHFELFVPELFSPNGDGKNDKFEIKAINDYPNNTVQIFNRWGSLIYFKKKYANEWDGKANVGGSMGNAILPSGTYFVILDFGDGVSKPYKGYVQLEY